MNTPISSWIQRRLDTVGLPSSTDEANRRRAVTAIAMACAGAGQHVGTATNEGTPRTAEQVDLFRQIAEGRAAWNGYSACVDLVGFVAGLTGLRDETMLNRDDDNFDGIPDEKEQADDDPWNTDDPPGTHHWLVAENMTIWVDGARKLGCFVASSSGYLPQSGDFFYVGSSNLELHVGVHLTDAVYDGSTPWIRIDTLEGGQVDAGGQCVKLLTRWLYVSPPTGRMLFYDETRKRVRVYNGFVDTGKIPLAVPARIPPGLAIGEAL